MINVENLTQTGLKRYKLNMGYQITIKEHTIWASLMARLEAAHALFGPFGSSIDTLKMENICFGLYQKEGNRIDVSVYQVLYGIQRA
jgi:hypothetical protein